MAEKAEKMLRLELLVRSDVDDFLYAVVGVNTSC